MQNEGGDDLTVFELDADRASLPREAASRFVWWYGLGSASSQMPSRQPETSSQPMQTETALLVHPRWPTGTEQFSLTKIVDQLPKPV